MSETIDERSIGDTVATQKTLAALPYCVYPGGSVEDWGDTCSEWLDEHVGEARLDWYDSADEYMDRVPYNDTAQDTLNLLDYCVWFRRLDDAVLFRMEFDARH